MCFSTQKAFRIGVMETFDGSMEKHLESWSTGEKSV